MSKREVYGPTKMYNGGVGKTVVKSGTTPGGKKYRVVKEYRSKGPGFKVAKESSLQTARPSGKPGSVEYRKESKDGKLQRRIAVEKGPSGKKIVGMREGAGAKVPRNSKPAKK